MKATTIAAFLLTALASLAAAGAPERVTLDFDGVDTSGGYATGLAVRDYLAGFGVTTPNSPTVLDTTFYANFIASPTRNIITGGDGRNPTVLTFQLATPASEFSFVRAGVIGARSPSGTIAGDWTATAYDSKGIAIASVGEGLTGFFGDRASAGFLLTAPPTGATISQVTFRGYDHGFAGINVPHITNISFVTTDEENPCGPPRIGDVLLPNIDLAPRFKKPWHIHYPDFWIGFDVAKGVGGVECEAVSDEGTLDVFLVLDTMASKPSQRIATTTTQARVRLFDPGAALPQGFPPQCSFEGDVRNDCILNGDFRIGTRYLEWHTVGFRTSVLGRLPKWIDTGPLTFYVDVDAHPDLAGAASFDALLRKAEAYLHHIMIRNLGRISRMAMFLDPGVVRLVIHSPEGESSGILGDGAVADDIPNSFVLNEEGNPAIAIAEYAPGTYLVELVATGTGPYLLAVQTYDAMREDSRESIAAGTVIEGMSLAFTARLGETGMETPLTPQPGASLTMLRRYVDSMASDPGASLSAKLREASAALSRGVRDPEAVFRPFLNEVAALDGKKIDGSVTALLTVWARAIAEQARD